MAKYTGLCVHCGTIFSRSRSRGPAPRYCSATCRARAKNARDRLSGKYAAYQELVKTRHVPIRHDCICTVCNVSFTSRMRSAKYCRPLCARRAYTARRKADGRQSAQRVKLAEYNKQYRVEYRQRSLTSVPCAACGAIVQRDYNARYRQTACSQRCKQYLNQLKHDRWPSSPIPAKHPVRSTPVPLDHPSRAAKCRRCNADYHIQWPGQMYCTRRCKRAAHAARREITERGAYVASVSPQAIYERDQWRCQLCRRKVARHKAVPHPMAPTLDHIIPLACGGTHEPTNVHTAHFICNARKGNRGGGEQFLLFG